VYQAGTLSGNPLAVTAGITTLKILQSAGVYGQLEEKSRLLENGILKAARTAGIPLFASRVGAMFTLFFTPRDMPALTGEDLGGGQPVTDWNSAKRADTKKFGFFFHEMLKRGIYLAPSQFEAGFLSTAHEAADLEKTIAAAREAFAALAAEE
jgi:glutamate-1-semialdehyde 2,1-aminomutase